MDPMEATTVFFFRTDRTLSNISWEGPTPPPGVSIRRMIALILSSLLNFSRASLTGLESRMTPFKGTTPIRSFTMNVALSPFTELML